MPKLVKTLDHFQHVTISRTPLVPGVTLYAATWNDTAKVTNIPPDIYAAVHLQRLSCHQHPRKKRSCKHRFWTASFRRSLTPIAVSNASSTMTASSSVKAANSWFTSLCAITLSHGVFDLGMVNVSRRFSELLKCGLDDDCSCAVLRSQSRCWHPTYSFAMNPKECARKRPWFWATPS